MTRGHADHSDEFDVVVSPGDVHFAAVWDDFVIKEQALISGMKFLMTLDPGNLPCPQLQLSFHFFRGNQTSVALSHHDTFFTWTAPILDEIHESMHSLILTFAKTMPPPRPLLVQALDVVRADESSFPVGDLACEAHGS
jgi:hypothetical protein